LGSRLFSENRHPFRQRLLCAAARWPQVSLLRKTAARPARDGKTGGERKVHKRQPDKILTRGMPNAYDYGIEYGKLK
jgi:hypothetical protein